MITPDTHTPSTSTHIHTHPHTSTHATARICTNTHPSLRTKRLNKLQEDVTKSRHLATELVGASERVLEHGPVTLHRREHIVLPARKTMSTHPTSTKGGGTRQRRQQQTFSSEMRSSSVCRQNRKASSSMEPPSEREPSTRASSDAKNAGPVTVGSWYPTLLFASSMVTAHGRALSCCIDCERFEWHICQQSEVYVYNLRRSGTCCAVLLCSEARACDTR